MNLRSILLVTAAAVALADIGVLAQTPSCREVSVEGDATYCIQGSVCSGKGDKPTTTGCPKAGDVAVKACLKQLKSYTAADKCVAPVNAECKKGKGDVWGCVWPTAVSPPTPTPATTTKAPAATTPAPKPASPVTTAASPATTTNPTTTAPPVSTAATLANANREISVEGDATYSIPGPICSGKGDKPAGNNCPKAGDVAVKDCLSKLKSYTNAGKCIAPVNAECKKIKTGAWGCVWAGVGPVPNAPATTVPATTAPTAKPSNATSSAPTTTAPPATTKPPTVTPGPQVPPATMAAGSANANREVSVEGDATYSIPGPICSGKGDKPAGNNCPKAGDVAVKDCLSKLKSYTNAGKCIAPVNAECKKIKTGAWGCVWAGVGPVPNAPATTVPATTAPTAKPSNATSSTPATTAPPATTKPPTVTPRPQTPPATTAACREVSVEGDATYCIQGSVCSGKGDKPTTTGCPKAGDVAVKACLKQLKSYTAADKCVAPVNADCKKGKGDVWGCVWPTAASSATTKATNLAATANEATGDDNSVLPATLAVGAAAAIAAAAFVFHRNHQQQKQLEMEADLRNDHVTVITP